jgi:hypothetical protein
MLPKLPFDPEFIKSFSKNTEYILSSAQKAVETAQLALNVYFRSIIKIPESTRILAEKGWYLPYDFHPVEVNRMASHIKEGNSNIVDADMIIFIDDKLANIQDQINIKFPKRSSVINAGIRAHKKQEYYLSIPVFFTQIEGICEDITGKRFFRSNKSKEPLTNEWVKNFEGDLVINLLLEPLKYSGPMRKLQDFANPIGINRHDVLHGNCVDYGDSKINGYKVLSLLNYIGSTVFEAKRYLDKKGFKESDK